jgi:hypothetical protein
MAKLTVKSTKEAWILALLADTNQFPKMRAALKPLSAALLAKRKDLKAADVKKLVKTLDTLAGLACKLYVEDIWVMRKKSLADHYMWFAKEAVTHYDAATGMVNSEPLRAKILAALGGGCGDDCGHQH